MHSNNLLCVAYFIVFIVWVSKLTQILHIKKGNPHNSNNQLMITLSIYRGIVTCIQANQLNLMGLIHAMHSNGPLPKFLTTEATIYTTNVVAKPFSIHHWHREAGMIKLRGTHVRTTCQRTAQDSTRLTFDQQPSPAHIIIPPGAFGPLQPEFAQLLPLIPAWSACTLGSMVCFGCWLTRISIYLNQPWHVVPLSTQQGCKFRCKYMALAKYNSSY